MRESPQETLSRLGPYPRYPDFCTIQVDQRKGGFDPVPRRRERTRKLRIYALVKGHPDNGAKLGYDLNVRWGGISRQFIDFYYDSPAHTLAKSLHSIRHRTRSTSDPRAPSNEFAELEKGQLGRGLAANPVQEHTDSDRSRLVSGRNR